MRGSAPGPSQGTHHRRDRVGAHRVQEVAYGNEEVQHQGFVVAVSFELKRGEGMRYSLAMPAWGAPLAPSTAPRGSAPALPQLKS